MDYPIAFARVSLKSSSIQNDNLAATIANQAGFLPDINYACRVTPSENDYQNLAKRGAKALQVML